MKKTIVEIYALFVCFAAIVCAMFAISSAVWSGVKIAAPSFTVGQFAYQRHTDISQFRNDACKARDVNWTELSNKDKPCTVSKAELIAASQRYWDSQVEYERRGGLQSLAHSLIILLLDAFVFATHWVIGKRARQTSA